MKTLAFLLIVSLLGYGTSSVQLLSNNTIESPAPNSEAFEEFFAGFSYANPSNAYSTTRFNASPGENLTVRTSGGSITVTGADTDVVTIEMYVRSRGRYLTPADDDLSNFDIVIERDGSGVLASASRRSRTSNILRSDSNISISFVVTVPRKFNTTLSTSGGSLRLANLDGSLNGRTSGGSITLDQLDGRINMSTSGGSIRASKVHGDVDIRTSGGSIRVSDSSGSLSVRTSGGSLTFENVSGSVTGNTSGGSIRADITELLGDVSLRTSGGSIRVDLPENTGLNLDLRGDRLNVPLRNFSGNSSRNRINGKMGDGGHTVSLATSSGSVTINFK